MKFRVFTKAIADSDRIDDATKLKALQGMLRIQESKEAECSKTARTFDGLFVWSATSEDHFFWGEINSKVFLI